MGTESTLLAHAVADRLGITLTDSLCLDVLDFTGPTTPGRLAEALGLTSGAITGVIDRLEEDGFVRREPDPHDRRRVIVHLLTERMPDIVRLFEPMAEGWQELLSSYSPKELALVLRFCERANELLRHTTDTARSEPKPPRRTRTGRPPAGDAGR